MNDFNFFSPYLAEKQNKRLKKQFTIAVSSLLIIALFSFTVLNMRQISRYKDEISKAESYMKSSKTVEMLDKYKKTAEKLTLTKSYYEKASEAADFVKTSSSVNTVILDKLSSVMTKDSTMTNLAINNSIVEIQYKVQNINSIAQIEHNLKSLDLFENVHVNAINNETNYIAIISCNLKDVDAIEVETHK